MKDSRGEVDSSGADEGRAYEEKSKQRLDIADMLRRTFYAGLGAIFTSEEGIRRITNDFSLPKDVAVYLISQAQSTKNELFRVFASEIRSFLENLRVNEELQRLLAGMSIEVKTEVRFVPNDEQLGPKVKRKVRIKRTTTSEQVDDAAQQDETRPEPGA